MLAMTATSSLEALLPSRQPVRLPRTSPAVQLSVRVPPELRDALRESADRSGLTLSELVISGIKTEIARHNEPAAQFSEQIASAIRNRMLSALEDGSWDEAVRAYTASDPDLAC
jgi:hypothetical protein